MRHHSVTRSSAGRRQSLTPSRMRDAAFSALSDPTRRAMLDLLRTAQRAAGEIARAFPVSRPAISKHLGILRRAHLVAERKQGRHRIYHLNPGPLQAVDSWLGEYRSFWAASLANLKSLVEQEYAKERATGHPKPEGKIMR